MIIIENTVATLKIVNLFPLLLILPISGIEINELTPVTMNNKGN